MHTQHNIKIGIIGGSGLGDALGVHQGTTEYPDTPFGKPSAPIVLTQIQGLEIAILQRHGLGHVHPPTTVPYRANIFALKLLGITHILASGAVGSLKEQIHPGDLVLVDQIIDRTTRRTSTFYEKAAVHVEMSRPVCPVMHRWLLSAAERLSDQAVHPTGTYVCMEGPAFSTIAESNLHRSWGADLIGMTALPEAKLAREAEIAYTLIGLPTDYDCWRPHGGSQSQQELLAEIIGNLKKSTHAGVKLIQEALADISYLRQNPSPAHEALKLAIWSDKTMIDQLEVQRLWPLWGRHFSSRPQAAQ